MKAMAEETHGVFTLLEDRLMRGKPSPLHTHTHLDETMIVVDGEILVHADGAEHLLGRRGIAVDPPGVPPGVPHTFMVTSKTARILKARWSCSAC